MHSSMQHSSGDITNLVLKIHLQKPIKSPALMTLALSQHRLPAMLKIIQLRDHSETFVSCGECFKKIGKPTRKTNVLPGDSTE